MCPPPGRLERLFFRLVFWAVVLFAIGQFIVPAEACDCQHVAYEALKRIGITLKTVPAVVATTGPASYYRGVASIRPGEPCSVYIHEFSHHDQWLHGLEAPHVGDAWWWTLETNAKAIERRALENGGQCNASEP
jgi:hypothetical protein